MKKRISFYLFMLLGCFVFITSCSNDDELDFEVLEVEAGHIPGLGNEEGELTGTPFSLPEGISLIDDITGSGSQYGYWNFNARSVSNRVFVGKDGTIKTQSLSPPIARGDVMDYHYFGSGYGYVNLLIPMRNTKNQSVTVTFPAALILENESGYCQNGVLLKKVEVKIPAGSDYYLNLSFYCGNADRSAAGSSDVYTLGVVSNAAPLVDLCNRLKNKRINIEEFDSTSYEDYSLYNDQIDELQDIVWEITDYDGLKEEHIAYINSLPNS